MKRIGVVSRIHGINYGANLQALALQEAIKSIGHECTYINYVVGVPIQGLHRKILSLGYSVVRRFLGYSKRLSNTKLFSKNIKKSPILNNKNDLYKELDKYDVLMSGSDQIWNPRYYGSSHGLYFFENVFGKKKISYASSFGVTSIDKHYKDIVHNALSDYTDISCRESTGVKILERLGLRVSRHIDPTFLLTSSQWSRFFDKKPLIKEKYICCYVMSGADTLNNYIIKYAEKILRENPKYTRIVILGEKEYKGIFSKHIYYRTAGPTEFLNIMHNAEHILTSSFHGTCFSIIFNKNFNSVLSASNKFNSRISDLLELFNLQNRIIYSDSELNLSNIDSNIDFDAVNTKIAQEREAAYLYLKKTI